LQSLLGLQAEDDDGNKAAAPVKRPDYLAKMNNCKTLLELQDTFLSIKGANIEEIKLKDKLKTTLK